ncbi:hypothetical protein [Kribbella sp. NPDC055071]
MDPSKETEPREQVRRTPTGPRADADGGTDHPLLDLQAQAGNQAVSGAAQARSAIELDAELEKAVGASPPQWAEATRVLNGFSDADISGRVKAMAPDRQRSLLTAVEPWNHRVRAALLDGAYERAKAGDDWDEAAVHLNGFNAPGIDERVGALRPEQVWELYNSVLTALSGVSRQRLIDAIVRVQAPVVSAAPGTDAIRVAATMQAQGVPAATAASVVLGGIGLPGVQSVKPAADKGAGVEDAIKILGAAMSAGVAAVLTEPKMLAEGKLAHTIIGGLYASMNMPTLADPTIIKIVQYAAEVMDIGAGKLDKLYKRLPQKIIADLKMRPDILDIGKLQVYEIKSMESADKAVPEMNGYLELLASIDIPGFGMFRAGVAANPGAEGVAPWPDGGRLIWCCPWPGAIVYRVAGKLEHNDSPERLRADVRGDLGLGVESMVALGLLGPAIAALLPEAASATAPAAAAALARAAISYETLIPLLTQAALSVGQKVPALP